MATMMMNGRDVHDERWEHFSHLLLSENLSTIPFSSLPMTIIYIRKWLSSGFVCGSSERGTEKKIICQLNSTSSAEKLSNIKCMQINVTKDSFEKSARHHGFGFITLTRLVTLKCWLSAEALLLSHGLLVLFVQNANLHCYVYMCQPPWDLTEIKTFYFNGNSVLLW